MSEGVREWATIAALMVIFFGFWVALLGLGATAGGALLLMGAGAAEACRRSAPTT